ncbi:hypothetical protein PFLUV_G00253770 [Perca fluviatilis]|uniref:Serpin B6 n=1 Tax=Perca fluviatilis TaxID=8168 RepID=A0A6A5E9S0_PERFL|nr:hypothetical protein PFLUV_G00253770 [Perca fluviatilis]
MASPTPLSKANTTFSLALLKTFGDDDKTANIFYSPFSISSALAMVMLGRGGGNTATQMSEDFLGKTKKYYNAELETVDFLAGSEAARLDINSWVQKQTQDKIKDLLAKGDVDSLSRLVLVNAMYFKSDWNRQFQQCDTQDAEFRLNKNDTKPVKMMYQETLFPFFNNPKANCKILEMPYKGKELSMLIFLPNEMEDSTTGLEKLEKQLTYENFMEWTRPDMMDNVEVQVGLPRFKMEESYDMEEVLVSMGMVDAFDEAKSDFSGMSSANDLVVSKVVHKAFVEVNEEGTEAAAATAAIMKLESCMISCPSATFIADHPFLFFIRHNSSMSILFAGRYCSPE